MQKGQEFAILTDEITKAWSGYTTKQYKNLKDLKKENLRNYMTNLELVLNMLEESTTTEISKEKNPKTFEDNKRIAHQVEQLPVTQEGKLRKKGCNAPECKTT